MRNIKKRPKEIMEFKKYLEQNYKLSEIKKDTTIWTLSNNDSIIANFGRSNRINAIIYHRKNSNSNYYQQHGDIIQLTFNNASFIEKNQDVIFDYTEKGLKYYEKDYAKSEIADRIYIFR
jgi:hypothetical protein